MLTLGRQNSHERVAAFLIEMRSRLTAEGVTHLPMSRRDIADYLGLRLETVSRAVSEFSRIGFLKFLDATQRSVVILDRKALAEMTESK